MRTIKITLSGQGINAAIRQIEAYKRELTRKIETFVNRLSDIGIGVITQTIGTIPQEYRDGIDPPSSIAARPKDGANGIYEGAIILGGSAVLFIEFSAGVTYGQRDYPLPSGDGYGMGTYPGEGHWDDPDGWWYYAPGAPGANEQGFVHTYGTRAYMPMYKADLEICRKAAAVAKEVFG